ncbi:hypothetical protein EJB05_36891, partial [Eragrostis curvula]
MVHLRWGCACACGVLDGVCVVEDVIYILEDIGRGSMPFYAITDRGTGPGAVLLPQHPCQDGISGVNVADENS